LHQQGLCGRAVETAELGAGDRRSVLTSATIPAGLPLARLEPPPPICTLEVFPGWEPAVEEDDSARSEGPDSGWRKERGRWTRGGPTDLDRKHRRWGAADCWSGWQGRGGCGMYWRGWRAGW
jgi:hypothetical protein